MDEKKNIDRLFQEKFKDYEIFPDDSVWKNIEDKLMKKKKRRIVPLWLRIGGAAAILLLLTSAVFWYYNQDTKTLEQPNEIIITNTDTPDKTVEKEVSNKEEGSITFENKQTDQVENQISKAANQNYTKKTESTNKVTIDEKITNLPKSQQENLVITESRKKAVVPQLEQPTKTDVTNTVDFTNEKLDTEKVVIAQEETINEQKDTKTDIQEEIEKVNTIDEKTNLKDKWSVGSAMTPLYYNTLGNGSPIDPALANNTKNSEDSFSYGLKVNYKLSDKLSLQSGINTLELGYTTENVTTLISSSLLEGSNTNINTNIDGVSVRALSTVTQNSEALNQRSSFDASGSLDQSLSYVEVPLEVKYNIVQKKLGVNVIGGFSTYFLYQNRVSVTSFGKTTILGEASNINSMNFSGNLGVDFDYNISKKLFINVSPMFKYQFNTFSENSGGFRPYYLGVYTGLNFRF